VHHVGVDYFGHPAFVSSGLGTETHLFHIGKLWQLEGLKLIETEVPYFRTQRDFGDDW
jgi:hypothetical protein